MKTFNITVTTANMDDMLETLRNIFDDIKAGDESGQAGNIQDPDDCGAFEFSSSGEYETFEETSETRYNHPTNPHEDTPTLSDRPFDNPARYGKHLASQ